MSTPADSGLARQAMQERWDAALELIRITDQVRTIGGTDRVTQLLLANANAAYTRATIWLRWTQAK